MVVKLHTCKKTAEEQDTCTLSRKSLGKISYRQAGHYPDWQKNRIALCNVQRFHPLHYARVLTKSVNRTEKACNHLPMPLLRLTCDDISR